MGKGINNETFLERSKKIHGDKYDYSMVDYSGWDVKVKIICPIHGIFEQTPRCHLSGECFKCSKLKFLSNKEEFIKKSIKKHGDKYDYSLVEYKKSRDKIKIICSEHGIFIKTAQNHLNGQGCPKCSGCYKRNTEMFIEKSQRIHGDKYDYSLVNYKNRSEPIEIICREHGIFKQIPYAHLRGSICYKCHNRTNCENSLDFIEKSQKIHGDKYDYSLVNYQRSNKKLIIVCKKHGSFLQTASSHLRGYGCPICKNSKGEEEISKYLYNKNIYYEREKRFEDCRNILPLPFDFFLPNNNICIEFDGEQHFKNKPEWGDDLLNIQNRDSIKNIYCKEKGIILHRISYKENLIEKLEEIFK